MRRCAAAFVGAVVGLASTVALAADITGAGASFPFPIYAKWAEAYKQQTGNGLNYQSIGSSGGIKQIIAKTVTFGASDAPMKPEDLEKNGLVQWPQVMGGVVPAVNLPGVNPGDLVLDGKTLGEIFVGNITKWNDPQIKALNSNLNLPNLAIAPVYRSDGSGTTFLFTTYLSQVSPSFKQKVGGGTTVQWPAGIGAKGNEGVASMTRQTQGAIGYVEYAYVKQNKMNFARLINAAGKVVEPDNSSFQAAAANADWKEAPGFYLVLTNQPGDQSWPITGASFILMHKDPADPTAAKNALDFFRWAYEKGPALAEQLDYVAMPASVVDQVETMWSSNIKTN